MKILPPLVACLLCVSVSACGPGEQAAAQDAAPPPLACDRDGSMPEIKACAGGDLGREQARMQRYLDAALVRARENDEESAANGWRARQTALLSESQRAWQAYVDSRCAVWAPDGSGGTTGALFHNACLTHATRQRTHDIWSDYLTYMSDSTPPVLPEPVRTIGEDRAAAGLN